MVLSHWHGGVWGGIWVYALCYRAHQLLGAVSLVTDPWYRYKHSVAYNPLYNVLLHNTSSSQQYNGAPHFIMEQIKLNYVTGAIRFWYQSHATGSIVTSTIRSPTFVNSEVLNQILPLQRN